MPAHPASAPGGPRRAGPDLAAMARRVAEELAAAGVAWPSVAAAARAARGAAKQGLERFATELDVDPDLLRRVEAGEVDPAHVPPALHRRIRLVVGDLSRIDPGSGMA